MCGIVCGIAKNNIVPLLLEGLKRLEYRGYDSAGLSVINKQEIFRRRAVGKVVELEALLAEQPVSGHIGIAHTRWATHGKPSKNNAHPHISRDSIAVVHNGIIENYQQLRAEQIKQGFVFTSETDTEVVAHQICAALEQSDSLLAAVKKSVSVLEGSFALGIMSVITPDTLIACRKGSPLVIGIGNGEYFIASDVAALLSVTQRFIFLEDGDIAQLTLQGVIVYDAEDNRVEREIHESLLKVDAANKGSYRHYMLKEIYEQPFAISQTLADRFVNGRLQDSAFGHNAAEIFDTIKAVQIIGCGTSYHAGMVARYWFEELTGCPCQVEVASEYRYRHPVIAPHTLIVTLSQSGETADTLAALLEAKKRGASYALAICNVAESSLVRASDLVMLLRAGPEIGVASTKAFTTQLVALMMLVIAIGRRHQLEQQKEQEMTSALSGLPKRIENVLALNSQVEKLAEQFSAKRHALFLGRGEHYPIAMEGALKLKEISYIHAEAYPAGELKHGPLALIDGDIPVITVAPNNRLLEKLKANMQEVSARGGRLIVFMDETLVCEQDTQATALQIIKVPVVENEIAPIVYIVPLQLLAYHVAVLKGTDVDQPRNLAKSVTVE